MTLLQMNYLVEIAECGSINRAAKKLFVSQSSISSAIRELEEELGIAIFLRNNKGVEFTDEGHRFFDHIKPIVEQEKKVLDLYAGKGGCTAFRLHISSQHYPFTVQAFVEFIKTTGHSRYDLQLKETNTYYIIEDVYSGDSDLGILFLSNSTTHFIGKILDSRDLEFHLLKEVLPHAFVRKGHPLAQHDSLNVRDLDSYPYAVFNQERTVSLNFSEEVALTGFEPSRKTISINDRCTMYSVLFHTDAFSIGTGLLADGYSDPGIVSVPIQSPADLVQLGWIQPKNRIMSQAARDYIVLLQNSLTLSQ